MVRLSHSAGRKSMHVLAAAAVAAGLAWAGSAVSQPPAGSPTAYYGRWAVAEEAPRFTTRGRMYKTIDIAPCGSDFCGVSVSDAGACGPTLFRFRAIRRGEDDTLRGHGKWGATRKNVMLYTYSDDTLPSGRGMQLYLGDGYDFGERSDSMPMFQSQYRHLGEAQCRAR